MPHPVTDDRTLQRDLQQAIESLQYLDIVSAQVNPQCGNCQHFIAHDGKATGLCDVHCDRVLPKDRPCINFCGGLA